MYGEILKPNSNKRFHSGSNLYTIALLSRYDLCVGICEWDDSPVAKPNISDETRIFL